LARPDVFTRPPRDLLDTRRIVARCRPSKIGLVNSIIDAYEGLAVVRTIDAAEGLIEFWVMPREENALRLILADLAKDVDLRVEEFHGV